MLWLHLPCGMRDKWWSHDNCLSTWSTSTSFRSIGNIFAVFATGSDAAPRRQRRRRIYEEVKKQQRRTEAHSLSGRRTVCAPCVSSRTASSSGARGRSGSSSDCTELVVHVSIILLQTKNKGNIHEEAEGGEGKSVSCAGPPTSTKLCVRRSGTSRLRLYSPG
jgi:hypothetical protein